jgi:hypothetical protein
MAAAINLWLSAEPGPTSGVDHHMRFALYVHPGIILLSIVVSLIILCTLISIILKELYRRW